MTRTAFFKCLLPMLFAAVGISAADAWAHVYPGNFSSPISTGPECDEFFEGDRTYSPSLYFINSPRGVVLHFPSGAVEQRFFDDMTLVGTRGYNDILFKKEIMKPGGERIWLTAEGFSDVGVLYLEFRLQKFASGNVELPACQATSEFAGFSRS